MQYVRLIKQDHSQELYYCLNISIDFNAQLVKIWNDQYWEETPFKDYKVIASFDAEEDYQDKFER